MDFTGTPHFSRRRTDTRPWYRQFWPWFLIAVPASAVVMGIVTAVLAVRSADGLVVDDYYKQGLAINRTLARDKKARALGMTAIVRFAFDSSQIDIQLAQAGEPAMETALELQLLHPTIDDRDYTTRLVASEPGTFSGKIPDLATGEWYVLIESEARSWRLFGRASLPGQSTMTLGVHR
ncbi:MAG: FixH family protein [Pseudomonadota bacterium]|nr:FixH family protein [Pseudomonadota bacterium]